MLVIRGGGFAVIINSTKVTGSFIHSIYDIVQSQKVLEYWNRQDRFPSDQNEKIDWYLIRHARESLTFDRKIWITKQVSRFCDTGMKMKLWKYRYTDV